LALLLWLCCFGFAALALLLWLSFFSAFASGALRAPLRRWTFGPLWRGGRVEESPKGGRHGCRPVFRQDRDVLSKNPGTRTRTRRARHRGGLSLGYFSLATQREVTRWPAGQRKPAAGEPDRDNAQKSEKRRITPLG
jgi:hypothetical protein